MAGGVGGVMDGRGWMPLEVGVAYNGGADWRGGLEIMADLERTVVVSELGPQPLGAYSNGMSVAAGRLVFVAGQLGLDAAGDLAGPGDAAAQTEQALRNIGHILAAAGADFGNVVEFTTYVVGRESVAGFIEGRNRVFPGLFPDGGYPPNTLLVVSGLVREEFLVEIKAVAALA